MTDPEWTLMAELLMQINKVYVGVGDRGYESGSLMAVWVGCGSELCELLK